MSSAAPKAIAIQNAINDVMSNDRGRLLAGLISRLSDFQLAEDALQEALISALSHWGRSGIPHAPTAWLMKVALNKGIDRLRSQMRESHKVEQFSFVTSDVAHPTTTEEIPDERLRLIFACCHPALEIKSRVALTLRTVSGLTTREIADAFLDTEKTMGQRLTRSKSKIKAKGIGFAVPQSEMWDDRLNAVLATIYLIFTTGYVIEDEAERDLCGEAIFLGRLLNDLKPNEPEIEGILALMLLTHARLPARVGADGLSKPIEEQDRSLWQETLIEEGRLFLRNAVARRSPQAFQIKAAIADCHMTKGSPDWIQMSLLYQSLWHFEPTPVIALNWAVVMAELGHLETALKKIDSLSSDLSAFQPWHAARASILLKLGHFEEAITAYKTAIETAPDAPSRAFLAAKLTAAQKHGSNN
ncbi:sigma-70 family RNA polymerase sigma factor [uncultured Maritalea sp.]|jgi:RNA polymerase sigma factor (sigma-70 family)|uniref:RNA polymerase sigma factor n=1 Tax=uncultured Maritalea sp. TaxID=757249 RepID=UPI00261BFA72|nr:sigma-70 family RNA polymerase sigma factor [uncultured Maritalea sp.]